MKRRVAPVRERGLKSTDEHYSVGIPSRSREGAWIEIPYNRQAQKHQHVAPVRERGLKYVNTIGATA